MNPIKRFIWKDISIAPLVTFRVLFGFIMAVSIIRFAAYGWIQELYIDPVYYFSYYGLSWIKPLGSIGMYIVFIVMLLAAIGICLGYFYRHSVVLFFLAFTYVELIDKTNYLNHYYFVSLIAFLLIWVPAHRSFSLDVYRNAVDPISTVPAWCINIFKLQLTIVYFFAGLAKINPYWLQEAMPLKLWLPTKSHIPIIGNLFQFEWAATLFSWIGMLYDLTIAFFLLLKRTRLAAYLTVLIFHLLTAVLFQIGMFPYIMILSSLIFFSSERHIQWQGKLKNLINYPLNEGVKMNGKKEFQFSSIFVRFILIIFFAIQFILPFRHHLYPGDLFWTEQGYRFSWRVMLMEKAGFTTFRIEDQDGQIEYVDNSKYLNLQQEKMMSTQPDMILQYAHYLKNVYDEKGFKNPKVYCDSKVTMNGRRSQVMINPEVDLAKETIDFRHKFWITDFNK